MGLLDALYQKIDVGNKFYYEFGKPENFERTKNRLEEIDSLGMTVVGYGQFGIKDVMSGLYIEKVWHYNAELWKDYIDWVKYLLKTDDVILENKQNGE